MKFEVSFSRSAVARNVDVVGPGALYLDETGIVVEGEIPRFYIPLVARVLRQIICTTGIVTIPFSRITKYSAPGFGHARHQITYLLPDRTSRTVTFSMRYGTAMNNAQFTTRLEEYRAAVRTFHEV